MAALFPPGVVAAVMEGDADPERLHPLERAVVTTVAPKRLKDFAAGRECARLVLAELGIHSFPLLPAPDRQPVWPPGITGSISHTQGIGAAVVARTDAVRSIGLDMEVVEAVHEELWPRICGPEELAWITATRDDAERRRRAALSFAAKESFYKCQYPLTSEWLGFEEVRIEVGVLAQEGALLVWPKRPIQLEGHATVPVRGAYRFHEAWVTVGVSVP